VPRIPRFARFLAWIVISCAAALLLLGIAIQLERYWFRHRAEQLLSALTAVDLRTTRWATVQESLRLFSASIKYSDPCKDQRCEAKVDLKDFAYQHLLAHLAETTLPVYLRLGGRPARVIALIEIRNGVIWAKSLFVNVEVTDYGAKDSATEYTLIADARTVSHFPLHLRDSNVAFHPEYRIGRPDGCEICVMGFFEFTPYADPQLVRRFEQFDLSCLSRIWHKCTSQADIMPAAWSSYEAEVARAPSPKARCEVQRLDVLGRDADNIVTAELISSKTQNSDDRGSSLASFKIAERLKHAAFAEHGEVLNLNVFSTELFDTASRSALRPGSKWILLLRRQMLSPNRPTVLPEQCGVIPLTRKTVAAIQAGIALDFRAYDPAAKN
jgi:hypothetical protein